MGDISFYGGSRGGSGGVTNYNELSNRPVTNVTGNPVVLSTLPTGVYNILGTWAVTQSAEVFDSPPDDLFYIVNSNNTVRATRISAEGVYTITCADISNPSDVVYDTVAMVNEAVEQVKQELWGEIE